MSGASRIRRGDQGRRRVNPVRRATPRSPARRNAAQQALDKLPVPIEGVKRFGRYCAAGIVVAAVIGGLCALKLPQMAGIELGEAIGHAGFTVKRVDVRGIKNMDRLPVYSVALDQESTAMPLVDLEAIRAKLMQFGWVADARVSRRLPDTLVVDIVERAPVAVWQHQQKLALVDAQGVVLSAVKLEAMPEKLPLVIGPGANGHVGELAALMEAAPGLKPTFAGATWIGDRRWDIRFQSGETLALPEGAAAAKAAIVKFQRMDATARLLGQGFLRFDMRVPDKFVVRVPREPGEGIRPKTLAKPVDPGTT